MTITYARIVYKRKVGPRVQPERDVTGRWSSSARADSERRVCVCALQVRSGITMGVCVWGERRVFNSLGKNFSSVGVLGRSRATKFFLV